MILDLSLDLFILVLSDTAKINTYVENFPQLALNHSLNGAASGEPNLSDLIKVHPKDAGTTKSNSTDEPADQSKPKVKKVKKKTQAQKAKKKPKAKTGESAEQKTPQLRWLKRRKQKSVKQRIRWTGRLLLGGSILK